MLIGDRITSLRFGDRYYRKALPDIWVAGWRLYQYQATVDVLPTGYKLSYVKDYGTEEDSVFT
jgi:hypothetical protein